jgi:hypothetical protein
MSHRKGLSFTFIKCKSQFDSHHLTNNILHKKWNVISSQLEDIIVSPQTFLNFVAIRNSCCKAKWPSSVTSHSEIVEKTDREVLYLPYHHWFITYVQNPQQYRGQDAHLLVQRLQACALAVALYLLFYLRFLILNFYYYHLYFAI